MVRLDPLTPTCKSSSRSRPGCPGHGWPRSSNYPWKFLLVVTQETGLLSTVRAGQTVGKVLLDGNHLLKRSARLLEETLEFALRWSRPAADAYTFVPVNIRTFERHFASPGSGDNRLSRLSEQVLCHFGHRNEELHGTLLQQGEHGLRPMISGRHTAAQLNATNLCLIKHTLAM